MNPRFQMCRKCSAGVGEW